VSGLQTDLDGDFVGMLSEDQGALFGSGQDGDLFGGVPLLQEHESIASPDSVLRRTMSL
jgi:hypothetical protein